MKTLFKVSDLENLIDQCNDVLDGDAEHITFESEKYANGLVKSYEVSVSGEKNIKNIRAMAYALRNALSYGEYNLPRGAK